MKFVFLTIPAHGHLNPMLGVIRELVKRRHQVIVYNTADFADRIRETGAEFCLPPLTLDPVNFRLMKNALTLAKMSVDFSQAAVPALAKAIEKEAPDCLVHDSFSLWGKVVAKMLRLPAVALVPSIAFNLPVLWQAIPSLFSDFRLFISQPRRVWSVVSQYRRIYQENGLTKPPFILDLFANVEDLNIVFTSTYFQPQATSFDKHYRFVGPIIYERGEGELQKAILQSKKPLIYISLGTIYNDDYEFYKQIINIFANAPYRVLISVGRYISIKSLGHIPVHITVAPYFPQLKVLQQAALFISHGGANSINESLYYGVPLLLVPQIQEQRINAARVEELGAGIYFKEKPLTKENLLLAMRKILDNADYRLNAEKVGESLKTAGGAKRAVEEILMYSS